MIRFLGTLLCACFLLPAVAASSTDDPLTVVAEAQESTPQAVKPTSDSLAYLKCLPRKYMTAGLEREFGEKLIWFGFIKAEPEAVIELYVNFRTTSWTVLATNPSGLACMIVSGTQATISHPNEKPIIDTK